MPLEIGIQCHLPQYQCHKKVWALKIKSIAIERLTPTIEELYNILNAPDNSPVAVGVLGGLLTPEEEGYGPISVTPEYLHKHNPQVGGYWVKYADSYQSYSSAKAFEEGYTLCQ